MIEMTVDELKAILLCILGLTTIFFGFLPIKVLRILTAKSGKLEDRASLIVSLLSCFSGGVFLGVCFLDLLPEAYESYLSWKTASGFECDYPFVPLMFVSGLFIVKILEESIGRFCGRKQEENVRPTHLATFVSTASNLDAALTERHSLSRNVSVVKSLSFVIALSFHASLEGFAFGVQETELSAASLFFGIFIHKVVVSFSLGMRLIEAHFTRLCLPIVCVVVVAIVTPLGGAIGIAIEESAVNSQTKDIVTCILLSFSLGVFVYIIFFEILVPEDVKHHNKFGQWFASVIGFAIIAGMMVFE